MKRTRQRKSNVGKNKTRKTRKHRGGAEINMEINDFIDTLNRKIQVRCPNLFLTLDYKENLRSKIVTYSQPDKHHTVVLCLYNDLYEPVECVSSIEFKIEETDKNVLYISSRTKDSEQAKKYNTLLRACSIVLANHWGFHKIISNAENPVSVWLLTKDYEYETDRDFHAFMKKRKITRELIAEYFADDTEFTYVDIYVPMNKHNVDKAYEIIDKTPFICNRK